jgi:signal transduction histidine kinase
VLDRLFQRFERASSMDHFGGLGLGLFLIREIVTAHGGSVCVANTNGGGALFRVQLPRRAVSVSGGSTRRPGHAPG